MAGVEGGSATRVREVLLREGAAEVQGEVETQVGTSQEAKNSTHSPGSRAMSPPPRDFFAKDAAFIIGKTACKGRGPRVEGKVNCG